MVIAAFRRLAYSFAPRQAEQFYKWRRQWGRNLRLAAEARRLRQVLGKAAEPERMSELILENPWFRPSQKKTELAALLRLVRALQPRTVCEIGSLRGGTLALFCQVAAPEARLLAIDLNFKPEQMHAFRHLGRPRQRITLLKADSHAPATLDRVQRWLGSERLDFLFIDGDHSLEGVRQDYERFAPLVRSGGLIGFHDIVPDYKARFGQRTLNYSGEVPQFWAELKQRCGGAVEFIEDPAQDGYGIGVLRQEEGAS